MSKFTVYASRDGHLRFVSMGSGDNGEHRVFTAHCDPGSRSAMLQEVSADFVPLDASLPLFLRQHFGEDGTFELFGHLTLPPSVQPFTGLADFTRRVLAAVGGKKGCCVDDRNRVVFWKVVDYLSQSGPVDLSLDVALFGDASLQPRFNF